MSEDLPKVGVLGGGQLGRMMQWEAQRMDWPVVCMDLRPEDSAGIFADRFMIGDINEYDQVMEFAKDRDVITVEIEHVNIEALKEIERQGKKVHPNSQALSIIKNKNRQKTFYHRNSLPTASFRCFDSKEEAIRASNTFSFPFIYKSAELGYDGKGVRTIRSVSDLEDLPDAPGLFEQLVDIKQEIAIMIARNEAGQMELFPPVEMFFDPENHILDRLVSRVDLDSNQLGTMESIAVELIQRLNICGVLAIEFFIDQAGHVLINEIAPRPHNSMHHTIENNLTSQFEQHLRGIMNLPLGKCHEWCPAMMVNILGAKDFVGDVRFNGWDKLLKVSGVKVHLYGKKVSKPGRKLGHITILDDGLMDIKEKMEAVKRDFYQDTTK